MAGAGQKRMLSDNLGRKAENQDGDMTSTSDQTPRSSADIARLQEELASLRLTVASLMAEAKGGAAKTLRAAGDLVSHKVGAVGQAAAEKTSSVAEITAERAQGLISELEIWARRRPLSAIAGAMLAGIIIGMLGRRAQR
ncbi:MAG TPA: hypothetical protein VKA79_01285 [Aestuariivirgaceae bacterium]|nr:hypothetical protein [Aestuariivirgaceae bacterium]